MSFLHLGKLVNPDGVLPDKGIGIVSEKSVRMG
jgi:hypothetical protein